MKKLLPIVVFFAALSQLQAQCLMYPVLLSERVSQSTLVIEGRVVDQRSFWNTQHDKIYTSNLIEVYKTFKNTCAPYVEIVTEGGIVGNDKHVFEPTLNLNLNETGVFTLNQNAQPSQFGKQVYESYGSAQGFIKYDVSVNAAAEPFNSYQNASSTLYNTISQFTGASYVQVSSVNPFQQASHSGNTVQNTNAISGFSPTTITAGTFSVLTITGTGFGTVITPTMVAFKNADDGGATTVSPVASQIVSWTNTQIQVQVPTGAGTGVIKVNGSTSTATLTIPYSQLNVTNAGTVYNTKHINQSGGGYLWTYNTAFNTNAPAKAAFQRSLQSWRCATYINWPTATVTSTITASASDGVNIVTFNSGLGAGILGQCGSYFSGCGSGATMQWFVSEMDIQFSNTPGSLTWQYGPTAPTSSQYDFESVTVHELGHGHQLGHVIKSTDLMHYALSNGQSKRTLNTDDLNGGLDVMVRNAQAGGTCSLPLMTPLNSSNCTLGTPTASFTANRTIVCAGQNVVFTDMSTGSPTLTTWTFAGGTPSTSTVSSPTVTYNTPGTYSVQLVATNASGSNTYSVLAYINVTSPTSLPLTQDFQTAVFPPASWYLYDAGNDNITWKLSTTAGYLSTQSTVFDNFSDSVSNRDELKSYVNLTGFSGAKMTFYRSYSNTFGGAYSDSLQIGVSTDCGTTLTSAYLKGGAQLATAVSAASSAVFTPTASTQWQKDSINLTPYIGQPNVLVSFINRGHYGDAIYIDNINITGVAATSPTAAITSATAGCTGSAITLTDASTGGPSSWTWAMPGGTPSSATTQNTSVTYTTAGVKTISLTVANASGTTIATKTITVTATPTVAASVTNTTICSGNSVVENLSGATTYAWLPSGSGSSSTLSPTATTVYTITGTTGACVSAVKSVTVTVTSTPTVNISATSGTVCAGQTVTLTASGATTYSWMPGSLTASVITVSPSTTTIYTVTGTNGSCSSTKTISVNVTTPPTLTVSLTNTTVCSGTPVTINVSGATTYNWLPSGSGASNTVTPSSTTIYTVTGSVGSCNSSPKTVTVNVNVTPTVGVTASTGSLCSGQSATLTATGATSYAWLPGSQTTTAITVSPASTTVYTVTGSNGTCSSTKTISIGVNTTPTVTASLTNTTVCSGTPVTVNVSGATAYNWLPAGSGASSILTPAATTVYSVTGANGACTGTVKTFTITVNTTPTVGVTASSNTICIGQTATLTASGATGYAWLPGSQTTTVITVTPATATTYTVTGTTGSCSSLTVVTVYTTVTPTIAASVTNTTACSGTPVTVNMTGAATYNWIPTGSGSSSALVPSATTVFTVTGHTGSCNGNTVTFTINVLPTPVINASASATAICAGSSSMLSATGASNYTWAPSANLSSATGSVVSANPVASTVYTVTASNGTCSATQLVSLTVNACTGIEAITSGNDITLYPNPNNGVFTVASTNNNGKMDVSVLNTLGQTVMFESSKDPKQLVLDMSTFGRGVYYVKIQMNDGAKLIKVVLQ